MSKFNDISRFKKSELNTYFFRNELLKYLAEKEKKKKKDANPFLSTVYSSIITSAVFYIFLGKKFVDLVSESEKDLYKALLTLFFAIVFAVLFYIIYLIYHHIFIPLMNKIGQYFRDLKISNTSNLNKLGNREDSKEYAKLEKFNHQVVDRIALVLSISNKFKNDSLPLTPQSKFYLSEAFQFLKKAVQTLEIDIITDEYYYEKILNPNYSKLKKYRIVELVPVIQEEIATFSKFWATEGKDYQDEIRIVQSSLNRINQVLQEA